MMEYYVKVFLLIVTSGIVYGLPVSDTQLVGSSLHQVIAEAPVDLLAAGDHSTDRKGSGDSKDGKGYVRSHTVKGGNGYKAFDSFHKKDGDRVGFEKHTSFGNKDAGGEDGEYSISGSYDTADKAGTANKPKFTSYHYETKSGSPVRKYDSGEDDDYDGDIEETKISSESIPSDVEITGPISGEKYQSLGDRSGQYPVKKRKGSSKTAVRTPRKVIATKKRRTKDPQTAATEGDYYYDDGGESEEGDSAGYDGEYEGGDYYSSGGEGDYY